jgi:hypothetical protein
MDGLLVVAIIFLQMVGTFALILAAALLLISWFDRALGKTTNGRGPGDWPRR